MTRGSCTATSSRTTSWSPTGRSSAIDAREAQLWARYRHGRLLQLSGDAAAAAPRLSQVHWDAEDANQQHALAGQVGIYAVNLHAAVFNDAATALSWAPHGAAAVRRDGDDVLDRAALLEDTGVAKLHLDDELEHDDREPEAPLAVGLAERTPHLRLEVESLEHQLEHDQPRERGHLVVVETDQRNRVDTAVNFCSAGLHGLHRKCGPGWPMSWPINRSVELTVPGSVLSPFFAAPSVRRRSRGIK